MRNRELLKEKYLIRYCGCLLENIDNKNFKGKIQCPSCKRDGDLDNNNLYKVDRVPLDDRKNWYKIPKAEKVLKILLTRETKGFKWRCNDKTKTTK